MQFKSAILALGLAVGAAPLSAQVVPRDPSTRRPAQSGTIGDIIFGEGTTTGTQTCRVRDARTPDGRVVQICDERRDRRGRKSHANDLDGDGDFDANDRAIRKREHQLRKQQHKVAKQRLKDSRIYD